MKKKIIGVVSCILLVMMLVTVFAACEQDDVQMDLMKKGFYTRYKKGTIENNKFDFIDRNSINWSIQASINMYEFTNSFKPGDDIPEKPFDVVYVIKFKDSNSIDVAKSQFENYILTEGFYDGPNVKVDAVVKVVDLLLYVGNIEAIDLALK